MRKIVFPQESNLQPLDYRKSKACFGFLDYGSLDYGNSWIQLQGSLDYGNPKAAGSIPVGRQFFALLVLSSRRSGGSSLGFRAGSL